MARFPALRTASVCGLASLLLLAGCSDGGSASSEEAAKSPLEEYLGALFDNDPAAMAAQQVKAENFMATCMSEKGFEYIPQDVSEDDYSWAPDDGDSVDQDTKEWVAKNGYGFSMTEEPVESSDEPAPDPNLEYMLSLSETAQAAYNEALYGPDIWSEMTEEEAMSHEYTWEEGGCQGAAFHETDQTQDVFSDPAHAELMEAMSALWEDQADSPRLIKLNLAWADCMADAGYADFSTPDEAQTSIMDAQNALWEELPAADEAAEVYPEPSKEALAEIHTVELATATADFTCKEKTGYAKETAAVQYDLEKQFVADHKAQLDALITAVESGKSK